MVAALRAAGTVVCRNGAVTCSRKAIRWTTGHWQSRFGAREGWPAPLTTGSSPRALPSCTSSPRCRWRSRASAPSSVTGHRAIAGRPRNGPPGWTASGGYRRAGPPSQPGVATRSVSRGARPRAARPVAQISPTARITRAAAISSAPDLVSTVPAELRPSWPTPRWTKKPPDWARTPASRSRPASHCMPSE
jgi:hypothetical protein